ncbi:MAG: aminotransferase class V-fold PLP-dependent enzyme [Candidatus Tectomicrobia bacterium]|uniref:cysteine desulfurase n=1 Tax=Tectimicrobiota bacterium TaxID=2528274 RepID=A0A932CQM4_UNCTE|nr:aminotransferase class V-fold PLP-dependent enzyme [Candidatus Tectomicrobia bacterium]
MEVYLDNAATSHPKPEVVYQAVEQTLRGIGGSPGRGGHTGALQAERVVFQAREELATLFGLPDSKNVIFTANATEALNLALKGLLRPGDHVLTSSMEHNSVLRPLKSLERKGVELTILPCQPDGSLDLSVLEAARRPNTRLLALIHASNVVGTLLPIRQAGTWARKQGILFLVDASQTAGALPLNVEADQIDLLAAPGHKGLMGPQGTGFLYLRDGLDLQPLTEGGTGSHSSLEEQPRHLPDRYQSGTLNTPGIAGLGAAVRFLLQEGLDRIRAHKQHLTALALRGLAQIPGIILYGPQDPTRQAAVISLRLAGRDPAEVATLLDQDHGIRTRVGLHCAPLAHRTLGTFPEGTLRLSFGYFTTEAEVNYCLQALAAIAKGSS